MAQKRMLDRNISLSEQIAELPVIGQLFFTWMIPHTDDFGLLPSSPRKLKALIIPFVEVSNDEIVSLLAQMVEKKLLREITYNDKTYYKIAGFHTHQTLKRDRQPQCILEIELEKKVEESWKKITEITEGIISNSVGFQTVPNGIQMESKWNPNGSKMENVDNSQVDPNGIQTVPNGIQMESKWSLNRIEEKRIEENRILAPSKKIKIPETEKTAFAASQPEVKETKNEGMDSIADVLKSKGVIAKTKPNGISTEWQHKAFMYAEKLGIKLSTEVKSRWLKMFKEAAAGRNSQNLERAYSFLADYSKPISDEEKVKYFFYIFENGVKSKPA